MILRQKFSKIPENICKKICNLYIKGISYPKISKMINLSEGTVYGILKRNNVKMRLPSEVHRKLNVNKNYFNKINTEEKAYFLGLMYADGCIIRNYGKIIGFDLGLAGDDELIILEKFKKELQYSGNIKIKKKKHKSNKTPYRISICSKEMAISLIKLGCVPKKSLILEFPTEIQVPNRLLKHFIRGYFDGDGFVGINAKKQLVSSIASSYKFNLKLKDFLEKKLKIYCGYIKRGSFSVLEMSGKSTLFLLNYLYDNSKIFLKRKRNVFENFKKYYKQKINDRKIRCSLKKYFV